MASDAAGRGGQPSGRARTKRLLFASPRGDIPRREKALMELCYVAVSLVVFAIGGAVTGSWRVAAMFMVSWVVLGGIHAFRTYRGTDSGTLDLTPPQLPD